MILAQSKQKYRIRLIEQFIRVAIGLRELDNFDCLSECHYLTFSPVIEVPADMASLASGGSLGAQLATCPSPQRDG